MRVGCCAIGDADGGLASSTAPRKGRLGDIRSMLRRFLDNLERMNGFAGQIMFAACVIILLCAAPYIALYSLVGPMGD